MDSETIQGETFDPNSEPINSSVVEGEEEDSRKKGRKVSVNSGQLTSKQSDSAPGDLEKSTQELDIDTKPRFDRKGNRITTMIGRFQTNSQRSKSMKASRKTVVGSDTGASELSSSAQKRTTATIVEPLSATDGGTTRHRVTFMDDISGDKKQLTEIHYIESYKKYNQEFYIETQAHGCCTIF